MSTTNKDFKVKNNLIVQSGQVTLGSVPLAFNTENNRLQIQINNVWKSIATLDDLNLGGVSFLDFDLDIDYAGNATYTLAGDNLSGVTTVIIDGGQPSENQTSYQFDGGVVGA